MSLRQRVLKRLEVPHQDDVVADRWNNHDLKPVEPARRTWGVRAFIELWILSNMNISGYQTGSSLVASGLTWWQALICIIFGNMSVQRFAYEDGLLTYPPHAFSLAIIFCTLNATSGAYYHIGYPAIARIAFGMNGSYFAVLNRILLSVVWCKLPVCALRHLDFTDRFPFQSPYRRGTAVSACSSAFGRSSLGTSTRSRTRSPRAWEWTARSSCATFCSCSSACRSRPSNHTSSTRSSRSAP